MLCYAAPYVMLCYDLLCSAMVFVFYVMLCMLGYDFSVRYALMHLMLCCYDMLYYDVMLSFFSHFSHSIFLHK